MIRDRNYRYSCQNGRKSHGFLYTARGSIRYNFLYNFLDTEPEALTAEAGTLIYIPRDSAYTATFLEDGTEHKTVQFDLLAGTLPDYLNAPWFIPLPNPEGLLDAFFRHRDARQFYLLACLYQLLEQVDACCSGLPGKYKRLLPAIRELSEHCSRSASVACYAQLCGMSEVTFRRLFKEYTGKSPIEYRNDRRLEDARNRIQSGEYNVSEAAEAAGFTSLSFFIRLYKSKYGHTPKQT